MERVDRVGYLVGGLPFLFYVFLCNRYRTTMSKVRKGRLFWGVRSCCGRIGSPLKVRCKPLGKKAITGVARFILNYTNTYSLEIMLVGRGITLCPHDVTWRVPLVVTGLGQWERLDLVHHPAHPTCLSFRSEGPAKRYLYTYM